jgi:hypothetical protein
VDFTAVFLAGKNDGTGMKTTGQGLRNRHPRETDCDFVAEDQGRGYKRKDSVCSLPREWLNFGMTVRS